MRYKITFEYRDAFSNGKWRKQSCELNADTREKAISKCIDWYGLEMDCECKFLSVEQVQD